MYPTALSRLVRADLPCAPSPQGDPLRIEAYLYEMVVELSDADAAAFLDGLARLDASGEANDVVRSVIARMIRLIECDAILDSWS
jgi:hypothetical protein